MTSPGAFTASGASCRVMARSDASLRILTRQVAPQRATTCYQPGLLLDNPGSLSTSLDVIHNLGLRLPENLPNLKPAVNRQPMFPRGNTKNLLILDQPGLVLDHPRFLSTSLDVKHGLGLRLPAIFPDIVVRPITLRGYLGPAVNRQPVFRRGDS